MPPGTLDYITVRGFKSIAAIDRLPLKFVNVLIGANGSGKSNFIGVFSFLHAIRQGHLRSYVANSGGAEKVLHFGSKRTREIYVRLSFGGETSNYELVLAPTTDDGLYAYSEAVFLEESSPERRKGAPLLSRQSGREAGISEPQLEGFSGWIRQRLEGWRLYHVHDTSASSPMRKTAKVEDNKFLRPDGSNLAAFLYYLQQKEQTSYSLIRRTVQRVAPFFDDFKLIPSKLKPDDIKLEWTHKNSERYFDASSFSDGTLRFIVLTTLLLQPQSCMPSMVLIDEPELGLHPYAIEVLASLIRQASERTQVIVSTQSSLLLDHFDPGDVLVANRVEGGTVITRLDQTQLKHWLQDYSLGQLWEKNEFAGRPAPE